MSDRTSREMLVEYLTHCGSAADEDFERRSGLCQEDARMEPLSVTEAIAADLAFDDAIAAAIERKVGKGR